MGAGRREVQRPQQCDSGRAHAQQLQLNQAATARRSRRGPHGRAHTTAYSVAPACHVAAHLFEVLPAEACSGPAVHHS